MDVDTDRDNTAPSLQELGDMLDVSVLPLSFFTSVALQLSSLPARLLNVLVYCSSTAPALYTAKHRIGGHAIRRAL